MAESKSTRIAEHYEGFGATTSFGAHVFWVHVPTSTSGDILITEDFGLKGGENGVPAREPRVTLPRRAWSAIAESARKDFAARLKARKLTGSRWTVGDNKVDRMLGKELCVLAWAAEHAVNQDECRVIAAKWAALKPEERWWLFSQTVAEAGLPEDKDQGWRKALYFALSGGKAPTKRPRTARPKDDGPQTLSMF